MSSSLNCKCHCGALLCILVIGVGVSGAQQPSISDSAESNVLSALVRQEESLAELSAVWRYTLEEDREGAGGAITRAVVHATVRWVRSGLNERLTYVFDLPQSQYHVDDLSKSVLRDPRFLDASFYFDGQILTTHYLASRQVVREPAARMFAYGPAPADFLMIYGRPLRTHLESGARVTALEGSGASRILTLEIPLSSGPRAVEIEVDSAQGLITRWTDTETRREVSLSWGSDGTSGTWIVTHATMLIPQANKSFMLELLERSDSPVTLKDVAFQFEAGMLVGDYSRRTKAPSAEPEVYKINSDGEREPVILIGEAKPATRAQTAAVALVVVLFLGTITLFRVVQSRST